MEGILMHTVEVRVRVRVDPAPTPPRRPRSTAAQVVACGDCGATFSGSTFPPQCPECGAKPSRRQP
jgi:rubrerythrin